MRVALYHSNSDVRIEEVARPEPGPGEVLVKVEASGICGSDVMEWYRRLKAPLVLGHEIAGTIEEVGAGVAGFGVGDRVTASHHVPCNTCRFCLAAEHSVCETLRTTNFIPGGFAEYVKVPAINVDRGLFGLPEDMTFEVGSFSEPLGCVIRGFRKAGFAPAMSVLVIGSGISGLLHVKLARALGAGRIIATDINEYRLEKARAFGADAAVKADEDVAAMVRNANDGRRCDLVFLTVSPDAAIEQALSSIERAGTIVFFAPREPGISYPMPIFNLWRDSVTIKNTYASAPVDTASALALMGSGRVEVEDMISHRLPLDKTGEGFGLVARAGESLKVMIEPHKK